MRFRRTLLAVFLASLAGVAPRVARAEPSREDVARADQLFREAQQLSQRGQHAEACPKLAESQALDPANGTLLNLAICHENEGKNATAHRELQTLLGQLSTSRDDKARARLANERLKSLEKKLARITFDTSALPPGATITLDGTTVEEPGAATPVDPGAHSIVVTAKQKKRGTQTVEIHETGVTRSVKLDALEDEAPVVVAPPPAPEAPPPPPPPPPSSGQRTAGLVVGGVGIVGLGVGAGFGLRTLSLKSDRDQRCDATSCDAEGLRLHDRARTSATISTVGTLVGAAALVGGVVLYLTAKPNKAAKPSGEARLYVTPDGLGFRGL